MARTITVRSQSNPNKSYSVTEGADGNWYCTCPAWRFQRKPAQDRHCKHMRHLADQARQLAVALDHG